MPRRPRSKTDREALVALYNATGAQNWTTNLNWLSDEPLREWYGVRTDDDGRVTYLSLARNNLSGEIPSELGNLVFMTSLQLQINRLEGEIPTELGNLAALKGLILWGNKLSGEIPGVGEPRNLSRLELMGNELSGEIPPELGNMASLGALILIDNRLSGEIPPELGNLANLWNVEIQGNQFRGCAPNNWQGQLDKFPPLAVCRNARELPRTQGCGHMVQTIDGWISSDDETTSC